MVVEDRTDFYLNVEYREGICTISCTGPLTAGSSDKIGEAVELCLKATPNVLVLDLSQLTRFEDSCVEPLIACAALSRETGVLLKLSLDDVALDSLNLQAFDDLLAQGCEVVGAWAEPTLTEG